MSSLIAHSPGGVAPHRSVAFGSGEGIATPVDASHPLPTSERGYQGAIAIVPGTQQSPQRAVAVICTGAGMMTFQLADASTLAVPIASGLTMLPLAVTTIVAGGTSAVASCFNLV